ncbi:vacuolar protein sorting-associated protein 53, putative [Plasmodium knowlesi strain H]|uniref:Vacuolar protein sorting-associated protein 53, putative n=3 Tax=Plasmodium knowlesi TaxID=5850 RepID=A0A5K1USG8_PLAKH|nr:vacuolar protein sorting-associated protein 53, putative [Plasmodium knowlesi strain H]OTN66395.1 putative Vacuolar protein sorting-associated protein 53 [Plasmodium knowlesi]CAA9986382.1 vacuolar protein sorting-associated protein 53, putative [Plasmodium knowlesi strain H]SBO25648.1 vacuolar protein sorting-associated protein 53, putative [Plasmodium knowlesi strain H]SBO28367.1 vacuolar protein sorting-associated protein 53, putative [Plasmodium knowlesi strain H]VVS75856.1 vacuolar prot|eukprot:XP_002257788.1 Vps53-like protein, putative [Plasmodium knowlesi strain H]
MGGVDAFVQEYINNNIVKIEDVEIHVEKMNREIMELDKTISEKVESHILSQNEYDQKLRHIKEKMKIINKQMEQVDKKTEESEQILVKLCKDIKKLDIGKKNVTETIIVMKRIVMVITAISSLKKKALKREYSGCIPLISVIKEMLIHISDLRTNEKLKTLYKDANILFDDVKHQIMEDIDLVYDPDVHIEKNLIIVNEDNHAKGEAISINLFDACNCLYHLDQKFVSNVVKKFSNFFLEKYIIIFENQANNLEGIDRRMAWLKRALNTYEHVYAHIFPAVYNMPYHIVCKFCSLTKKHIVKIMSSSIDHMNPVSLIQTVIKVINFENFLSKNVTFFTEKRNTSDDAYGSLDFPFPELIMERDLASSEGEQEKDQMDDTKKDGDPSISTAHDDTNSHAPQNFKGVMSCAFDSYLCSWLKYEEKKILQKFENIIKEENREDPLEGGGHKSECKWSSSEKDPLLEVNKILKKKENNNTELDPEMVEEKHTVYKSAYKMFYLYKSYINMILQFSDCQTLYDFVIFFKTLLLKYSEELNKRIVKDVKEENRNQHFKLLSVIINTSYYVEQTMNEAFENLVKVIDPIYKDKICFKEEEQQFLQIKTKCIKGIIVFVEKKINSIISNKEIANIFDPNDVQGKTPYITNMDLFLREYFSFFKKIFNETYLIYLLEKTTTLIIQQFYHTIFSFQFMTNLTAHQLLLDCHEMEKILFQTAGLLNTRKGEQDTHAGSQGIETEAQGFASAVSASDDECIIPQTYFNYVKNQTKKIEFLIKIFISNIYDMNSFNMLLTENNNICTIEEIEKILSMKEDSTGAKAPPREPSQKKNYVHDIKERGMKAAEEVKFFFNKITSI